MSRSTKESGLLARQNDTFRICTAEEFGSSLSGKDKVRGVQTTKACNMCRQRKVRCIPTVLNPSPSLDSSPSPPNVPCQPCLTQRLDCRWDNIDGRKRKRARLSGPSRPSSLTAQHDIAAPEKQQNPTGSILRGLTRGDDVVPSVEGDLHWHDGDATSLPEGTIAPYFRKTPIANTPLPYESNFLFEGFDLLCPSPVESRRASSVGLFRDWINIEDCVLDLGLGNNHNEGTTGTADTAGVFYGARDASAPRNKRAIIRLRYYRRLGPTAIVPGFRRLSVVVTPEREIGQQATRLIPEDGRAQGNERISQKSPPISSSLDDAVDGPYPKNISSIMDVFFAKFGGHFPYLHPDILGGHLKAGEASSFLMNAIAALTLRFCPLEDIQPYYGSKAKDRWRAGVSYLNKAKEQLGSVINVPSSDVVSGLIILAWAEFGNNNEAGLWVLSGLAIRITQDVGFHHTPEMSVDPEMNFHDRARPGPDGRIPFTDEQSALHQQKSRLANFWTTFILDVYVSLITGRPPTLRRNEVEAALPTLHDMKITQLDNETVVTPRNLIFPATVSMMVQYSEALQILNQVRANDGADETSRVQKCLSELVDSYKSLPSEMVFNAENFKTALKCDQAGLFLTLHLFYYTFVLLLSVNRHQTMEPAASPTDSNNFSHSSGESVREEDMNRSRIRTAACQKILHILEVAGYVDTEKIGLLSSPFINHCLYVAAIAIYEDVQSRPSTQEGSVQGFLSSAAVSDYDLLKKKLEEQAIYYGAIGSVVVALKKQEGSHTQREKMAESPVDDEDEVYSSSVTGFKDSGIIHRYTIR